MVQVCGQHATPTAAGRRDARVSMPPGKKHLWVRLCASAKGAGPERHGRPILASAPRGTAAKAVPAHGRASSLRRGSQQRLLPLRTEPACAAQCLCHAQPPTYHALQNHWSLRISSSCTQEGGGGRRICGAWRGAARRARGAARTSCAFSFGSLARISSTVIVLILAWRPPRAACVSTGGQQRHRRNYTGAASRGA